MTEGARSFISDYLDRFRGAASIEPMLAFFLSTLDVRTKAIAPRIEGDTKKATILTEVQTKLADFPKSLATDALWNEAYRLERLLALIEPPDGLLHELRRRTNEAFEEGVQSSERLKKALDAASSELVDESKPPKLKENAEIELRMLLLDAIEELHWEYQKNFYARPLQKQATSRTVIVGVVAFCLFLAPYAYLYTSKLPDNLLWAWLPMYSSLTSGLFGAFFSRLIYLQTNITSLSLGAIKDSRQLSSILSRGIVGMCGALIVYFFLQSGLIDGSVFPKFTNLGITQDKWPPEKVSGIPWLIILPDKDLSLLVVWSFLAGFSERLVPNILASTEKTLSDATQKGKG